MRTPRLGLAVAALVMGLAACGAGEDDPVVTAAPTAGEVVFVGDDAIAWEQETLSAELVAGELDVTLVCAGAVPHNLVIEGVLQEQPVVDCAGGDEETATVALEPGAYDVWCSIPGHREAGMEGVLTVS